MRDHNSLVICTDGLNTKFLGIDMISGGYPFWNDTMGAYRFYNCQIADMIEYCNQNIPPEIVDSLIVLDYQNGTKIQKLV